MASETQTPDNVAQAAAIPNAIALNDLSLIGLLADAQGPAALLRDDAGDIQRVRPGDQAFGHLVVAMDDNAVQLSDLRGNMRVLKMPQD